MNNIIMVNCEVDIRYTVEENGFYGEKFSPKDNKFPEKAIITFTGSDGSFKIACKMAEYFSTIGITGVAIAYWKAKGLPKTFDKVPIESVENAAMELKKEGFEKVAVCGVSKGGELALLSGSMFKDINGVIAISPMYLCCMGFKGLKQLDASSWSYRLKEIPYSKGELNVGKVIKKSILKGEPTLNFMYEELISRYNPGSIIKVENINGPILLISADYDSMWPSKLSCEKIVSRLKDNNFKNDYKHLNYKYANHMIFPIKGLWDHFFKVSRKYKKLCEESKKDLDRNFKKWIREL